MLKKSLYFSNPYHLTCKQEQLIIKDRNAGAEHSIPLEDVAFIMLDHYGISVSQYLLQKIGQSNVALISCNEKHMPVAMLFPLDTHQTQSARFQAQVQATEPLKKQLWQQTIKQKIINQAAVLVEANEANHDDGMVYEPWIPLQKMAADVKSGDTTGREAKAARFYWSKLFGDSFNRERFGELPNPSLNYGYAIIRAAVARALCGSGLLPTLGIHHHNKYNAYCLADDIMEPYRPFVDRLVWQMKMTNPDYHTMQKEQKAQFLELLASDVTINGKTRPMMVAMSETTSSLADCFMGKSKRVKYPSLK